MKFLLMLPLLLAGCSASGWSRVGQSIEVGAGRSITELGDNTDREDWETDTLWVSVHPLAWMEPEPLPVRVPPPEPVTSQERTGSTLCPKVPEVKPGAPLAKDASVGGGLPTEAWVSIVSGILIAVLGWWQRQRVVAAWDGMKTGKSHKES